MKKKSSVKKKVIFNKKIKKTVQYQLLIIFLIVLIVLILSWVVLFILGKVSYFPKEDLKGELGTLKWDFEEEGVIFDVLDYNISEDNTTIDINLNWSFGEDVDLRSVLFGFNKTESLACNYTEISDLPIFGINKTYTINSGDSNCGLGNFVNVSNVFVLGEINIPLRQTSLIETQTFYKDDNTMQAFDLDNHFSCLGEISFSFVEDPENYYVDLVINQTTNVVDVVLGSWYGVQKFNLSASCDGEVLDTTNNGNNMSFFIESINDLRPLINYAPEFLEYKCESLDWEVNTNYSMNLYGCFDDEDGDDLDFRYVNNTNENLTIEIDGEEIKLIPDRNWLGIGSFYVYADDGEDETSARIYFDVREAGGTTTSSSTTSTTSSASQSFKISSSTPSSSSVHVFPNQTKMFSIDSFGYDSVKWYLDGNFVKEGSLSYEFLGGNEDYKIVVEVIKGSEKDSKTWNLVVEEDDYIEDDYFETGQVIFYLIIVVVIIVMFLVVWLFIIEKRSHKKKINIGFGISKPSSTLVKS